MLPTVAISLSFRGFFRHGYLLYGLQWGRSDASLWWEVRLITYCRLVLWSRSSLQNCLVQYLLELSWRARSHRERRVQRQSLSNRSCFQKFIFSISFLFRVCLNQYRRHDCLSRHCRILAPTLHQTAVSYFRQLRKNGLQLLTIFGWDKLPSQAERWHGLLDRS